MSAPFKRSPINLWTGKKKNFFSPAMKFIISDRIVAFTFVSFLRRFITMYMQHAQLSPATLPPVKGPIALCRTRKTCIAPNDDWPFFVFCHRPGPFTIVPEKKKKPNCLGPDNRLRNSEIIRRPTHSYLTRHIPSVPTLLHLTSFFRPTFYKMTRGSPAEEPNLCGCISDTW